MATTLDRIRAGFKGTAEGDSDHATDPQDQLDYLGLIDIEAFAKLQVSISGSVGSSIHLGSPSTIGTLLLGEGGSFVVRRVPNSAFAHSIDIWDDSFDKSKKFVVVKQPSVHSREKSLSADDDFKKRLHDAMMEFKVSYHKPLREHPNIVTLHSFMWDSQSNLASALAPSLILEYADLGTVSDFQDSKRLILHANAKLQICLDIAEGLSFLNQCGIIHGDVKCRNVLLFRDDINNLRGARGIRAKISDFGSAVIGVSEDPDCPKQALRGQTPLSDAPEKAEPMDYLGLRRMDMYSYGLTVWQIMCNGEEPYRKLYWDSDRIHIYTQPPTAPPITFQEKDFIGLKNTGNGLFDLAIKSLENRQTSDVDIEKVQKVLKVTMRFNPADRARSFDEIARILRTEGDNNNKKIPKPEPLSAGDFGVTSTKFTHYIYLLRTAPPSFRALICEKLSRYSSFGTSSKKGSCALALAACYFQGFYARRDEEGSPAATTPNPLEAGADEILKSAKLGHPIAQSLAPRAFASQSPSDEESRAPLERWLVNSMRCGSLRARNELEKLFPMTFADSVSINKATRQKVGASLVPSDDALSVSNIFDQFSSLDPAAKSVLSQPGNSLLHQAAYLGSFQICKNLIEMRKLDVDALNNRNETPLHYAARNGQLEVAQYLLDRGANIQAKRDHGAGVLHLALISYDSELMLSLLLSNGADLHAFSSDSLDELPDRCDWLMSGAGTALHFALRCEHLRAAKILLEAGANPNKKFEYILTPLQTAIQMHSMPLLEFMMPWAVKDRDKLPIVDDFYNPLLGYYAQPMSRWINWPDKAPLPFILPAVGCIKRHGINIDERNLLSWAFDSNEAAVADYFLRKLRVDGGAMKPFRDRRVGESGQDSGSQDFPLAVDLNQVLSMVLSVCTREMIETVLRYMEKPISSPEGSGGSFLCRLGLRQWESREDVNDIVSLLIDAGVNFKSTGKVSGGPLHNAASWNNFNVVDVLLDHRPLLADVQSAMAICIAKGSSRIAEKIMGAIFRKCPQVLVTPLPKPDDDFTRFSLDMTDPNYLRAFCSRVEFSQYEKTDLKILSAAIQYMKIEPGGRNALRERLAEIGLTRGTPLHYTARNANQEAAEILLKEGANINAYHVFPAQGPNIDLSKFNCMTDLSTLDPEQKSWSVANSGPTPLDEAYDRDWGMSLYQWPSHDQPLLKELRYAGGASKEEDEYEDRTRRIIEFLRAQGAKTRWELFEFPETDREQRKANLEVSRTQYKEKNAPKAPSDTAVRIMGFFGAACALQSSIITQAEYPDILIRADPARPRYSQLFAESISQFHRILSKTLECQENELYKGMEEELSKFETWGLKNLVHEGEMDSIADVPPPSMSVNLAAAILFNLREIIQTLVYIDELLASFNEGIDLKQRYEVLLADLRNAIEVLTTEEMSFRVLSDLAVAEVEELLNISLKDVTLDGYLKA